MLGLCSFEEVYSYAAPEFVQDDPQQQQEWCVSGSCIFNGKGIGGASAKEMYKPTTYTQELWGSQDHLHMSHCILESLVVGRQKALFSCPQRQPAHYTALYLPHGMCLYSIVGEESLAHPLAACLSAQAVNMSNSDYIEKMHHLFFPTSQALGVSRG